MFSSFYEYLESVLAWFLPQSALENTFYINFLLPMVEYIVAGFMIYFLLYKPIAFLLKTIGGWLEK